MFQMIISRTLNIEKIIHMFTIRHVTSLYILMAYKSERMSCYDSIRETLTSSDWNRNSLYALNPTKSMCIITYY